MQTYRLVDGKIVPHGVVDDMDWSIYARPSSLEEVHQWMEKMESYKCYTPHDSYFDCCLRFGSRGKLCGECLRVNNIGRIG